MSRFGCFSADRDDKIRWLSLKAVSEVSFVDWIHHAATGICLSEAVEGIPVFG